MCFCQCHNVWTFCTWLDHLQFPASSSLDLHIGGSSHIHVSPSQYIHVRNMDSLWFRLKTVVVQCSSHMLLPGSYKSDTCNKVICHFDSWKLSFISGFGDAGQIRDNYDLSYVHITQHPYLVILHVVKGPHVLTISLVPCNHTQSLYSAFAFVFHSNINFIIFILYPYVQC